MNQNTKRRLRRGIILRNLHDARNRFNELKRKRGRQMVRAAQTQSGRGFPESTFIFADTYVSLEFCWQEIEKEGIV